MEHVDFWHVGYAKVERKLIQSTSALRLEQRPRLPELRPRETWATRSTIGTDVDNESTINDRNYPYSTLHGLQPSMLDPVQSASVVGAERTQSNITISRNELQELVSNAVQSCINQNGATSTPKPL
ncbi:hypothetical protein V6N13_117617 [Hibiscus sabdariffa]|uniref:Uncharacterized protein n=1 Tax=Hibiscus sabdariffa TaxID=183260 RepID=A0ABR2PBJ6_9ROSI